MTHPQWIHDLNFIAGSKNRLAVLAWITQNPNHFAGEIATGSGIPRPTTSEMLRQLETAGLITGDLEPHLRKGRAVRYRTNLRKLAAIRTSTNQKLFTAPPPREN